jgi:hypothetical protein
MDFRDAQAAFAADTRYLEVVDFARCAGGNAAGRDGYLLIVQNAAGSNGRPVHSSFTRPHIEFQWPVWPAGDFSGWHSHRGRGHRR